MINLRTLFLENRGIRQTIVKNTFWLALGEGIGRILTAALLIYVARVLGAEEYGMFTFAFAFVSLLVIFADFGLSPITIRELSKDKELENWNDDF